MTDTYSYLHKTRQRSRQRSEEKSGGNSDFRRWQITLPDGKEALFWPMCDENGRPILQSLLFHPIEGKRADFLCTQDIPGYDGLCVYCHQHEKEDKTGLPLEDRQTGVSTKEYRCLGVWDPNFYTPRQYKGNDGKMKTAWDIWTPARPGQPTPEGAQQGNARWFRLSPRQVDHFDSYMIDLAKVCRCVHKTQDPERSRCYYGSAVCPECHCELYSQVELDNIGSREEILKNVFDRRHSCRMLEDGGCWTEQRREEEDFVYPIPVFRCLTRETDSSLCQGASPLTPFDGPMLVRREGLQFDTHYYFRRPETPHHLWMSGTLPDEAYKSFAKGRDFRKLFKAQSLEEQATTLGIAYPFETKTKEYKSDLRKRASRK
jgi:hypothetical protein